MLRYLIDLEATSQWRPESLGPPFGQRDVPERTSSRPWQRVRWAAIIDLVIHHADAALATWFGGIDKKVDISFDTVEPAPDAGKRSSRSTTMSLLLAAVREQTTKRNNETRDVRDDDGRVVARQRSTRYFELDYVCSVSGPHPAAHEQLGQVLQLMVDHDVVPTEHLPTQLAELDEPVEIAVVSPAATAATGAASLTLRLVVPFRPTADREIAEPAVELNLDVAPPPGRTEQPASSDPGQPIGPVPERKWTTVRRREYITPGATRDEADA